MKYNTKQEVFNKVWQHFVIDKNPKSVDPITGHCKYYSESGGCAVGCLIDDDKVKKQWDALIGETSIGQVAHKYPEIIDNIIGPSIEITFLADLQKCHDAHFGEIEGSFVILADKYNLIVPQA
jgi:hypothetical protein